MRDLGFLVADKNMEACLRGLFQRSGWWLSIGCAEVDIDKQDIHVAAGQADPGLFTRGNELLRQFTTTYAHMVVMVDAEWEGSPGADKIQSRIRAHLIDAGWSGEDGLVLVFHPEVDVWLWTKTDHTARALGWLDWIELERALGVQNWWPKDKPKPPRPKEAAEWALLQKRKARSAAVYQRIASTVGVKRCTEPAFTMLCEALRAWFPMGAH